MKAGPAPQPPPPKTLGNSQETEYRPPSRFLSWLGEGGRESGDPAIALPSGGGCRGEPAGIALLL